MPVGWICHANHGRDKTERAFHWICEIVFLCIGAAAVSLLGIRTDSFVVIALLIHTTWWIINGNFHVYVLDSFKFIRTRPKTEVAEFARFAAQLASGNVVARSVLIYGSACRNKFHERSDLDLRIVRTSGSIFATVDLLVRAVKLRIVSLWKGIPTDLQVVDSYEFLNEQMRADELPIVVWVREGDIHPKQGLSLHAFEHISQ
jgi:predicted nucleotidyltransferase